MKYVYRMCAGAGMIYMVILTLNATRQERVVKRYGQLLSRLRMALAREDVAAYQGIICALEENIEPLRDVAINGKNAGIRWRATRLAEEALEEIRAA